MNNETYLNKASLKLFNILIKKNLSVATAESCTGGLIAQTITNNPGSSKIFHTGLITYSNKSKIDKLAQLERAISNFMLDTHTKINGYEEISPPLLASDNTMYGTGQLPKFESDQFEIKLDDLNERKFLIPTAEVILTNMVKNQILNFQEL